MSGVERSQKRCQLSSWWKTTSSTAAVIAMPSMMLVSTDRRRSTVPGRVCAVAVDSPSLVGQWLVGPRRDSRYGGITRSAMSPVASE
jgi:hypothetical protein